jgi:hypothetical protein
LNGGCSAARRALLNKLFVFLLSFSRFFAGFQKYCQLRNRRPGKRPLARYLVIEAKALAAPSLGLNPVAATTAEGTGTRRMEFRRLPAEHGFSGSYVPTSPKEPTIVWAVEMVSTHR